MRFWQSRRDEIHPPVHLSFRVGHEDAGLDTRAKFPALATRKPADVPRVRVAARLAPVRCSEAAGCGYRQTSNRTIERAKPSARSAVPLGRKKRAYRLRQIQKTAPTEALRGA